MTNESKCPFSGDGRKNAVAGAPSNTDWWPNQLKLNILHQHSSKADPMGGEFNYAEEFKSLDLNAVVKDLRALMTDSQDWWPADFGHYGPLFIRMAWHSAGTYRIGDGRGGAGSGSQRFAPLNSWPDNVNLDKARRLLWPIKQKYGRKISWADLMILAGNVALDSMGFKTFGFAGGREDIWEPEEDIYWGPEHKWLDDKRYSGDRDLENPLGAVQMGLIYVNPEGPNGNPDPIAAARDIRETFARMAMNDEETVALIAGGHTFGKTHGAGDAALVGPEPEAAGIEEQGLGWKSRFGTGKGGDTITSGLEVTWTSTPTKWSNKFFQNLFGYEWELTKSPAGAHQWTAEGRRGRRVCAGCPRSVQASLAGHADHRPCVAVRPCLRKNLEALLREPGSVRGCFRPGLVQADASRYGPPVALSRPARSQGTAAVAGPHSRRGSPIDRRRGHCCTQAEVLASGLSISQLVTTAWASAATFRGSDKRGGANGARIRLAPQKDWEVNQPAELAKVLQKLERSEDFNSAQSGGKKVSLADLIVLGGCAAVEAAAKRAGHDVKVPFSPGRTDASQEQTDVKSFAVLEPTADGFRNYVRKGLEGSADELLVDKAQLMTLTAPEMTVLIGGLRALNANVGKSKHGVFTHRPETLTNDFFVNLLDMSTEWQKSATAEGVLEGRDRATDRLKWTGTIVDLVFGSNSQLRALAEVYACADSQQAFVRDFVAAWNKVMNLDRFDLVFLTDKS